MNDPINETTQKLSHIAIISALLHNTSFLTYYVAVEEIL